MNYRQLNGMDGKVSEEIIQRLPDMAFIPNDKSNRDWIAYQEWLGKGNIPLPPVQK